MEIYNQTVCLQEFFCLVLFLEQQGFLISEDHLGWKTSGVEDCRGVVEDGERCCDHYWRLLMLVSKLMVLSRKTRGPQALDWRLHQVSTGGLH